MTTVVAETISQLPTHPNALTGAEYIPIIQIINGVPGTYKASLLETSVLSTGVSSIGGATGAILLGTNLSITGNTLNATGGGGTPGGSNGQVQYNNSGTFGGFFVGGDGTLNATTGNLVVSKTIGVAFAASATTDTTTTANITDSTNKRFVTDAGLTVLGNTSGTNSGNVTLTAVGSTPSANGASLSGQALTLQPADGTNPGLLTSGTQTIGGAKTFSSTIAASNFSGSSSGANTGDQTITLTGAVTGSGTGSFATTIATPGTLTVATSNSTATAHTHAITSSSAPGAAASLLATDSSGILGSTGTRIVKGWFTDLTVTNNIAGSITGNAATVTTNANLTGAVTSSGNATSLGSFTSAQLAGALTDETGSGAAVFATSPTLVTPLLGTPTSGVLTNCTGTVSGLTAGSVTTNANLTGVIISVGNATSIASQTGTGTKFVVDTSPTLVTPILGVAAATSINKMAITAPSTSSTLAVADGKTLTASNTLTLTGTDTSSVAFGAGGTVVYTTVTTLASLTSIGNSFATGNTNFTVATTGALNIAVGAFTVSSTGAIGGAFGNWNITNGGKNTVYNGVVTAGWGHPAIYGSGRSTAQTAAVASVSTYTVGAADGSFIVSANANITTFVAGTFNVTVAYTDETNTAQTLKLNFSSVTGTLGIAIAAAGPFEGIPAHIRCKASTSITVATSGTFTSLTYNVEGVISQIV